METKVTSRFIKIHVVTYKPGHDIHEYYQRVDLIWGVGVAPEEFTKIGASGRVDLSGDSCMYTRESVDDLYELLNQVDLLP